MPAFGKVLYIKMRADSLWFLIAIVCIYNELRYRARSLRAHIEAFQGYFQSGFAAED